MFSNITLLGNTLRLCPSKHFQHLFNIVDILHARGHFSVHFGCLERLWGTWAPQYRFVIVFMRKIAQQGVANGDLLGSLGSFWAIWGLIWRTWGAKWGAQGCPRAILWISWKHLFYLGFSCFLEVWAPPWSSKGSSWEALGGNLGPLGGLWADFLACVCACAFWDRF